MLVSKKPVTSISFVTGLLLRYQDSNLNWQNQNL